MSVNVFQSGGADNNWSTPGNWSLGAVPTATDGHVTTFGGASPVCVLDCDAHASALDFNGTQSINGSALHVHGDVTVRKNLGGSAVLILAGAGTLTTTAQLELDTRFDAGAGTITLAPGSFLFRRGLLTYVSGIVDASAATLVSGMANSDTHLDTAGMVWGDVVIRNASGAERELRLVSDLHCADLTLDAAEHAISQVGPGKAYVSGSLTAQGARQVRNCYGSVPTEVVMCGTGTVLVGNEARTFALSLTIDTEGEITFADCRYGVTVAPNLGNPIAFKYVGGAVSAPGILFLAGSADLDLAAIEWGGLSIKPGADLTLISELKTAGGAAA